MKHQLPAFLTGVVVAAMVFTCAPAIAAQIQTITASANTVNIALNGKQVAAKGESYTLANGAQVPYSLSYSGTTYLPIRKVGELVGQEIYWDGKTGTAGVGVNPMKVPDKLATDYSTWTAEDEKAYQEFKGMWTVEEHETKKGFGYAYYMRYLGEMKKVDFLKSLLQIGEEKINKFSIRCLNEMHKEKDLILFFTYSDEYGCYWEAEFINQKTSSSFPTNFIKHQLENSLNY